MDKHVNFYFQSLLSTIIYVFDILFNLPESRKLRKILPGFSTSPVSFRSVEAASHSKMPVFKGKYLWKYKLLSIYLLTYE